MVLTIRPEAPGDRESIYRVNQEAFGQENESRLVDALRQSPAFVPELSLVAVERPEVVRAHPLHSLDGHGRGRDS
jgi:putative acetyltransferase